MELSDAIEVSRVNNVFMRKGPRPLQVGSLVLIGHHLIFSPVPSCDGNSDDFWLLHRAVDRVLYEPVSKERPSKGGLLVLKCKNFMIIVFEIPNWDECQAAAHSCDHDYPFYYRCSFQVLDDGWKAFDSEEEFARLIVRCGDAFRISSVNEGFKVCPSYPEKVIVPKGIGDDYLRISATFRDGSRFPVLSYFHKHTKSCILRCGQPLIGPTNRRCKEDENILKSLLNHNRGTIIDTRAIQIAQNARSKATLDCLGGGFESRMNYTHFRYMCIPIPRIREIHVSLAKMVELCNDRQISSDRFISRLAQASWLQCVSDSLNCAANVAQCVHCEDTPEVPVIVHGGEGTDTTLLATSLAQVMLDPDARTIRGFESLVEREWICAGHPFQLRNAHSAYAEGTITGPQESPVFLCFLDSVYQIIAQYPHSFEFGEDFLIFLFEHAYASEFGSFLGNNEMMKAELGVKKSTVSLWSYVNNPEILRTFVNTLYEPRESVIWPSVAPQSIVSMLRLFFRWQSDWTEEDYLKKAAAQWRTKERELISRALLLRR
ncbi:hypothetical protein Angca_002687 [Angiostrongylus cantonensis]|nr:hypothetical protein Angca_002687 [Angiostrongylus cantonensis]